MVHRILADTAASAGQLEVTEAQFAEAMAILSRESCDRHPDLIAAINSQGQLALARNDLDGALASFERGRINLAGVVGSDGSFAHVGKPDMVSLEPG